MFDAARLLDWGVACATHAEEQESGDLYAVAALPGGALIAVVDGLGHGAEAAVAAREAIAEIKSRPSDDIVACVRRCHERLRGTRGVVMSLAVLDARARLLSWLGVGNVEAALVRGEDGRGTESIMLYGGVIGQQLPALRVTSVAIEPGDLLVLATDGVRGGFASSLDPRGDPSEVAAGLLESHGKGTDDALVFAARLLPEEA